MIKRSKKLLSLIAISLSIFTAGSSYSVKAISIQDASTNNTITLDNGQATQFYSDGKDSSKFIDGSYSNTKVENENDAINSLNDVKELLNIDNPESNLKVLKINKSDDLTSYKLQQVHNDIPLYGREVVVVTDKEGNTSSVNGNFLNDVNIDTNAKLSKDDANKYAKSAYGTDAKINNDELVIYSLNNVKPTLCWKVSVSGTKDGKQYALDSFIDAANGNVINEVSLLAREKVEASGKDLKGQLRTFNVNKRNSGWYGTRYELNDTVRNIKIYSANNSNNIPGTLISNRNNKWTDSTAISAMVNLGTVYDFYLNNFNRNSYDNNHAEIVATVHYNESYYSNGYDNAFWSPQDKQFVFGDGDQMFTPLTGALDVTAHEFTHAIIERTANLEYQCESGALNEAYADILGNIIEGKNDDQWLLGEDIMKNGDAGLRNMSNPEAFSQPSKVGGKYYVNPTNPNDYNDYGGVHTNSGIINHAAYLMWKNGIYDKTRLARLFYNSLFIMNSTSDFKDCRHAVVNAAKNMNMSSQEINIVNNAFDEVGINA